MIAPRSAWGRDGMQLTSISSDLESAVLFGSSLPAQGPSHFHPLEIFTERAYARALLVAEGMLDKRDAVDALQQAAVDQRLVDRFGQDRVQAAMAHAFATGGSSWIR
jgi:hypothetical protein